MAFVTEKEELKPGLIIFQVYALKGVSKGIVEGKVAGAEEGTKVLFDEDFKGLDAAGKRYRELCKEAEDAGFKAINFMDWID